MDLPETNCRELLQQVLDSIPDEIMVIDREYRVVYTNRADIRRQEDAGACLKCHRVSHQEEHPCRGEEHPCPLQEVIRSKNVAKAIHSHIDAGGASRIVEIFAAPILNEKGEVTHVIETGRDITQRLEVERKMRESEDRLRLALEATRDGVWDWNIKSGEVFFSNRYYTMLGYEPGAFPATFESWRNLLHPEDLPRAEAAIQKHFFERNESYRVEFRLLNSQGNWQWILGRGNIVETDANNEPVRIVGTHEDITERKRAEERLHLLSVAVEQSREGIAVSDMDGHILFANSAFGAMHGYYGENLAGRHLSVFHTPEQMPAVRAANRQLQVAGFFQGEIWHVKRDGSVFPVLMNNALLRDNDGSPIGMIGCAWDITDLKHAEDALRRSERQFRSLIENASDVIAIIGPAGEILFVSPSVETVFGYRLSDLIGHRVFDFLHPSDLREAQRFFAETAANPGPPIRSVGRFRDSTGKWRFLDAVGKAVARIDGHREIIVNARDITERMEAEKRAKQQQRQLEQASKLATLGTLVAGVAHEINNPNFLVMANTAVLRSAWNDVLPILEAHYQKNGDFLVAGAPYSAMRTETMELFDGVREGGERIKRIVQELRDYARERPPDLEQPVDINAVVKSASALLSNMLKKATTRFAAHYAPDLPAVLGDPQRLEQVTINLIQNACQALDGPDCAITVQTAYDTASQSVIITIQDEGKGISPDALPRITDPFFTTRRDSGGTGLGLSISSSIVDAHHGRMEFQSKVGAGTTVQVVLPAVSANAD